MARKYIIILVILSQNIINSDAVETCTRKDCEPETDEIKTMALQSRKLSESEMADDDNAETSEVGDMSGLNQSNLSQMSSQKSTSLDKTKSDEATYRLHRIRKTTKFVKRCIKSELKFQPSVVRSACKLLNTPDELTLDDIEELNLKCQSALQSEYSSESGSGSDVEDLIHFKSQLIAPKLKGKATKLAGPVGETSTKKHLTSQSSFTFGQVPPPPQPSAPYFQQQQGYPYTFNQPPGYAPPPNFAGFQYSPSQYSQPPPQFKFGTQTFAYNTKPDTFQTPFHFQNIPLNKAGIQSPASSPKPTMSSTPKPQDTDKIKVNAGEKNSSMNFAICVNPCDKFDAVFFSLRPFRNWKKVILFLYLVNKICELFVLKIILNFLNTFPLITLP